MRVPVPLPFRDRLAVTGDKTEQEIHDAVAASVEVEVPLSILTSTQRTVGAEMLEAYSRGAGKTKHAPVFVESGGIIAVRDGHHRVTNAIQRGDRTIRAKVAHLGPPRPPIQFGHGEELLMMRPEATAVTYRERDVEQVAQVVGNLAVISIDTPTESKPSSSWWGYFDDYESIHARFCNALADDEIESVLLKIDSPGGSAAGLNECVDAMLRAKAASGKRVYAYADEGAYSAAYALACVADEIYLPRAGGLGSIGVISMLADLTQADAKNGMRVFVITSGKHKADGNPHVPMSKSALRHVQKRVDGLAKIYWQLVSDTRGLSIDEVRGLQANTFFGKSAVRHGLANGVSSLEDVLAKINLDGGVKVDHLHARRAVNVQMHGAHRE